MVPQPRHEREGLAFVGGKVVDLRDAMVPLSDRGFLLGDGVFETLRCVGGEPFRLPEHLARLATGLQALQMEPEVLTEVRAALDAFLPAARQAFGDDLYVRVSVSSGTFEDFTGTGQGLNVSALAKRFKPYPMRHYSRGVHVVVSQQRKSTTDPLSRVKSLSFLPYVAARREALRQAAHDAVLLNEQGRVAEGTTSNAFARLGNVVYAPGPDEGAIPGVTREVVLGLLREADFDVVERLEPALLRHADEAWLTNTVGGVIPMTRFEGAPVGDGKPGDLSGRLKRSLDEIMRSDE